MLTRSQLSSSDWFWNTDSLAFTLSRELDQLKGNYSVMLALGAHYHTHSSCLSRWCPHLTALLCMVRAFHCVPLRCKKTAKAPWMFMENFVIWKRPPPTPKWEKDRHSQGKESLQKNVLHLERQEDALMVGLEEDTIRIKNILYARKRPWRVQVLCQKWKIH